jgi:ubiquinone/menaquinone biosynthesis C-methylase UbiE
MFRQLSHRRRSEEWMDRDDADPRLIARSLRYIQWVNRFLGYTHSTLHHLRRFSRGWRKKQRIEILDIATGSADIPRAILRWGRRRGFDIRVTAIDRHAFITRYAAGQGMEPRLRLLRADAFALPFAPQSFDYVHCALFLHHLDDAQVVRMLRTMDHLARRGVIAGDLRRNRRAWFWINMLTVAANPMVKNDAPASVAQAFTRQEIVRLRDEAGLDYLKYYRHFGHRFVLAGEKPAS